MFSVVTVDVPQVGAYASGRSQGFAIAQLQALDKKVQCDRSDAQEIGFAESEVRARDGPELGESASISRSSMSSFVGSIEFFALI